MMAEKVLGFCQQCYRMRWLAMVTEMGKSVPHGVCTQCERENRA